MKTNYTHLAIVVDRSGSMQSIAHDVIGGLNTLLDAQRNDGEVTVTITRFDQEYEVTHKMQDLRTLDKLPMDYLLPRGMTALNDAVGRTVVSVGESLRDLPEDQRPSKVVFVILTDGQENASREFTKTQVADMVKHQRENYSWEFMFMGCGEDSMLGGKDLQIDDGSSVNYAANSVSVRNLFSYAASNIASYRASTSADLSFSEDQRNDISQSTPAQ